MEKRGRPKNPVELVKRRAFQIRLTEAEKQVFEEAARLSGLSGSSWARERLLASARKELKEIKQNAE